MVKPNALFIFHLETPMEMITNSSIRKRSTMAQNRPLLLTATGWKSLNIAYNNQGTGSLQQRKSK